MFKIPWQNTATDENKNNNSEAIDLSLFPSSSSTNVCMTHTYVRPYNQPLWNGSQLWNTPHWQTVQTERGQTRWTTALIFAQRHPTHVFSQCTIALCMYTFSLKQPAYVQLLVFTEPVEGADTWTPQQHKFLEDDEGLSWLDMSDSPINDKW
jgi:hypothetical protein